MSVAQGSLDPASFLEAVARAGVVGQGGAGFPAAVKYAVRVGTVIANGCECEPLLYTDREVLCRRTEAVVRGLAALASAVGASRAVLAIKAKNTEAAEALAGPAAREGLELFRLGDFYPAGDEHILVHEVTGRTIPPLGLPRDVDALVANVGTLASVAAALDGRPVTRKLLTVTGEVRSPAVIEAPLGAGLAKCLDFCGGSPLPDPVFLVGGPIMGRLLEDRAALDRAVVTKTTSGLIVLPRGSYLHRAATLTPQAMRRRATTACIQCRACTDLCPRHLVGHGFQTHLVMRAFAAGAEAGPATQQALLCSECGVCELFACPMQLSPRRINALLKARFREARQGFQGERRVIPEQAALRPYRKVPSQRLARRVGLGPYLGLHPEFREGFAVDEVCIPLGQHIGAPAAAAVRAGDRVEEGAVVGEIPPEAKLGARIHASIPGQVIEAGTSVRIRRS